MLQATSLVAVHWELSVIKDFILRPYRIYMRPHLPFLGLLVAKKRNKLSSGQTYSLQLEAKKTIFSF